MMDLICVLSSVFVVFIGIGNVCFCRECLTSEMLFAGARPKQTVTKNDNKCERWDALPNLIVDLNFLDNETASDAANFCRNPDESDFYWCFAIPDSLNKECFETTSEEYMGTKNVTLSRYECQRWDTTTPNSHAYVDSTAFPDGSSTLANNYCRDPDGLGEPWCFTTSAQAERWETCGIAKCNPLEELVRKTDCGIDFCEPTSTGCRRGWGRSKTGSVCYDLSGDKATWDKSLETCEGFGSQLLQIEDHVEYHFVKNILLRGETETFWIALTDRETKGTFVWHYSNVSPNFTDWFIDEPDNFLGLEDCTNMFSFKGSYFWKDDDCTRKTNYICETNMTDFETTLETTLEITTPSTTEETTIITTTSGCKQLFDIPTMAFILPVVSLFSLI